MKKIKSAIIAIALLLLSSTIFFACNDLKSDSHSISVAACIHGTLTVQLTATYTEVVTVTITPDAGYQFKPGSFKIAPSGNSGFASYKYNEILFYMPDHDVTIYAEFEKLKKTYKYDYQDATSETSIKYVTLEYENLDQTSFIVPQRENCIFDGWYLGDNPFGFFAKVSDENGNVIIGTEVFENRFTTLFARWISVDSPIYPILMVYVDEVQAVLKTYEGISVDVYYKMSEIEKQICNTITPQIWGCLNLMFNGLVNFELDSYFTTTTIGKESISVGSIPGRLDYYVFANNIPDVGPLLKNYRSVITTGCMNDYDGLLCPSGLAGEKYAYLSLESMLTGVILNNRNIESLLDFKLQETMLDWMSHKQGYLHEFAHTVEESLNSVSQPVYELHAVFGEYAHRNLWGLEVTKLYLFNQAEIDGKNVGIPFAFWKGKIDVRISYMPNYSGWTGGTIVPIKGIIDYQPSESNHFSACVPFGSDFSVEAIPFAGYHFVKWSDGITTAIRHDTNIISLIYVWAIFEKN